MSMDIKPIRVDADHKAALGEIERLWSSEPGTPESDRLEVLSILVEAYERKHFPVDPPDLISVILFRLEQMGLNRKALQPIIGSRRGVSEILAGKRLLSLSMVRRLSEQLQIPVEMLMRSNVKPQRRSQKIV